jgi:hypothetical protein
MRYFLPPGHPQLVAREGERWRSLDKPALVEALLALLASESEVQQ